LFEIFFYQSYATERRPAMISYELFGGMALFGKEGLILEQGADLASKVLARDNDARRAEIGEVARLE
jgi:hypothetical protein